MCLKSALYNRLAVYSARYVRVRAPYENKSEILIPTKEYALRVLFCAFFQAQEGRSFDRQTSLPADAQRTLQSARITRSDILQC